MTTALLAAATVVFVTIGMVAAPRLPGHGRPLSQVLARILLWGLMPVIVFFVMARLELSSSVAVGLLLGYAELAVVGTIAFLVATRVLHLSRPATGAVVVCALLANTGYLGLPLVTSLLGSDDLGEATAFDAVISGPMFLVVAMSIGAVMGERPGTEDQSRTEVARSAILRNPPLLAVVAGLLAPDVLAPDAAVDVAHVFVYATVPVAFLLVGITLREEGGLMRFPALSAPVATAIGLRLVVAPLLMLGLSALVLRVPTAYLLQAGMPCGANAVIVAHVHHLDVRIPAAAIAWSTTLVLVAATVAAAVT